MRDFIKTAVIGHPIHHSKSPLIHNHWIAQHNLNGSYEAIDIAPEDLAQKTQELINQGYAGFNVTVPHKEAIFNLCSKIDEAAQKIGAVNTVTIKNGKMHGKNTDSFGFIQNIRTAAKAFDFTAGSAFVLGAGGAARAVIHALLQEGTPEIFLTNRTKSRAETLIRMSPNKIKVIEWNDFMSLPQTNLLINTTSLGMVGKPALEIDLSALNKQALVTDIVYAPLQTNLLQQAAKRGNQTVTGIGMLLHQARPAFESWYGLLPEVDRELEELVLA